MHRRLLPSAALALTVASVICAPSLAAQWLKYPTAGVPRSRDGKPNLTAPTPRTREGKPDFSGIWLTDNFDCARSPDPESLTCGTELPMGREGINMGASLPGGLPYQPWLAAQEHVRKAADVRIVLGLLDWNGSVVTSAGKIQERIRRPDYGHLEVGVTVDDPNAYTRPWTVTLHERLALNTELVDEICLENEKSFQRIGGK